MGSTLFGTGYSSLSYLRQLPLNTLKIDQSFVRDLAQDKNDLAITRSIISMAKVLELQVVAEGVEDEAALNTLNQWKCELAQGYFIAKPMPADQLLAFIQQWQSEHPVEAFRQPQSSD
jgi:EAL domain-containing protein (putative c-di-GMP-specific phosphodiesterase class I)